MSDSLADLILSLTPEDGSSIGNGAMLALLRERVPAMSDEDYAAACNSLVDDGVIGRGRGRGGSIHRADARPDARDAGRTRAKPARGKPRAKSVRRSDEPVRVLSYRQLTRG